MQTWEVYRVTESIVPEQDYYSDKNFALGDLLATHSFVPQIYDSISVQGVLRKPHLRIKLDDALGQELLNPASNIYENNTVFKDFLKGVCIKSKAGAPNSAIIRFLPNASLTKLTLYYRDSSNVSRTYDYLSDGDSESVLSFAQNYNGTRVLENNQSDTIVYLQGMNGVSTRLEFPFIKLNGLKKQDNIYRLYCDKQSENGNKIPFLKKKTILKYGNEQKTPNSITYLFYNENPLIMTIDKNGHIYFKIEKLNMITVNEVESLIKKRQKAFFYI